MTATQLQIHLAFGTKEQDREFDVFVMHFLKPALPAWYKLEFGDAMLNCNDDIAYENASFKLVGSPAITQNAWLSSLWTEITLVLFSFFYICFDILYFYWVNNDFMLSSNFKKLK